MHRCRPAMRRTRERELVRATRALFDERGMQDAPIEEIARAVGIARGLIYRQFSSKEELFVLTVTDYLDELDGVLEAASSPSADAGRRSSSAGREAYAGFCLRYPAFLDCALSLMHRPARRAARDACPSRSGCASARAWRAASATSRESCATARGRRVRRRGPRLHGQRAVDADPRDDAPRAHPASACGRRRPASPSCSPSRPSELGRTCVASALATVGAAHGRETAG